MNRENQPLCVVFPMGMEAYPFLHRVEVRSRRNRDRAVYRKAFFEGHFITIVRCGVGPERAAAAIRNLDEQPRAILCVGTAGALVPSLKRGHMIATSETVFGHEPSEPLVCSESLVDAVGEACERVGAPCRATRLATVRNAVFLRADRERLHQDTGAHAVDMESHAVGLQAGLLGIPHVSLRVISDDIDAPPVPDQRTLRDLWANPLDAPAKLKGRLRRWIFLRHLRSAVDLLPPVVVRVIRTLNGDCRAR